MVVANMRHRMARAARPALYLAAAAILAALGLTALIYSGHTTATSVTAASDPTPAPASATPTPLNSSPAATTSSSSPTPTPANATAQPADPTGTAAVVDGGQDDAALQQALNSSSTPNLPAATAAELITLARARLTAQLRAGNAAAGLAIQAAVARRHDNQADLADVTVLYTVDDPAALEPEYRTVLTYAKSSSGWIPVIDQAATSAP